MREKVLALLMLGMLVGPTVAQATVYDFTASGFTQLVDGTPGPYDPVSGWFEIKFGVLFGGEVTVGPQIYGLSEIGKNEFDVNLYQLYATVNGIPVAAESNDFQMLFSSAAGDFGPFTFVNFVYAVDGRVGIWRTTTGSIVERVSVPEPSSLLLLGLGMAGLGLTRRRKAD